MKLRILDDTIRLRLERTEVDALGAGTAVTCNTRFPSGAAFGYRLEAGTSAAEAAFADGAITIRLPADVLKAWAEDETAVSIRESFELDSRRSYPFVVVGTNREHQLMLDLAERFVVRKLRSRSVQPGEDVEGLVHGLTFRLVGCVLLGASRPERSLRR